MGNDENAELRHKVEIYQKEVDHRIRRIEEKHDDAIKAIDKLSSRVESLGETIKRAVYVGVGGGGVIYFLASGMLPKILAAGGS
jgi:hypothetical protein